jgi:hypothetical protein
MRGLLNAYVRILIVSLAGWLCMTGIASAQTPPPPVATASQSFGFDYKDADLSAGGVVRFEMQIDTATFTSVAIPPKGNDAQTPAGSSTYVVPIPALTTGNHTVSFRACNAQLCGDASPAFSFVLAVKPATPSGTRIK